MSSARFSAVVALLCVIGTLVATTLSIIAITAVSHRVTEQGVTAQQAAVKAREACLRSQKTLPPLLDDWQRRRVLSKAIVDDLRQTVPKHC